MKQLCVRTMMIIGLAVSFAHMSNALPTITVDNVEAWGALANKALQNPNLSAGDINVLQAFLKFIESDIAPLDNLVALKNGVDMINDILPKIEHSSARAQKDRFIGVRNIMEQKIKTIERDQELEAQIQELRRQLGQ